MIESEQPSQIVLASASPRRCELLRQLGVRFLQQVEPVDERYQADESAEAYVSRLALEKARVVARSTTVPAGLPVLGADTAVVVDGQPLGKPDDEAHALSMLQRLSGRCHQVLSAVALVADRQAVRISQTSVWFRPLTPEEMRRYWASGEPRGKAGSYAIQGLGGMFVEHIEGSYSGVVGLPVFETVQLLQEFNIDVWR